MRATIRIENRTRYRTGHLRAFVVRARAQVFGAEKKPLRVTFVKSRRYIHGRASVGGSWSKIWLPPLRAEVAAINRGLDWFRLQLAQILVHELAHNAGAKGERWMRRGTAYGWGPGWQENVPWAKELPLELAAEPAKPKPASLDNKRAAIVARIERWESKAKRAGNALKKLRRSLAYYDKKLAASRPA
jgi:hypothetical protein